MFELLKIKIFGRQPVAKISDQLLSNLIQREYGNKSDLAKVKLKNLNSDNKAGKNRISADLIKLSENNINALDELIEKANNDSRDVIMLAEYPRCAKIGFSDLDEKSMKQIYIDDFKEYSTWLKADNN